MQMQPEIQLLVLALPLVLAAGVIWTVFWKITFTLDDPHLRVRVFGCTIRKIALADIEFADRSWRFWNEHYNTTLNPTRIVRLRRRSGWIRNFIITPLDPAQFLAELRSRGIECRD